MALEAWELVQRHKGNINAADMAAYLRKRYGDTPLPVGKVDVKTFSPEEHAALVKEGYLIYTLTGQSIK